MDGMRWHIVETGRDGKNRVDGCDLSTVLPKLVRSKLLYRFVNRSAADTRYVIVIRVEMGTLNPFSRDSRPFAASLRKARFVNRRPGFSVTTARTARGVSVRANQ